MFRPNIVIDSDDVVSISKGGRKRQPGQAYCEDEIKFAKLKNGLYLRLIGPCLRCKTTSINWEKRKRDANLEPYKTIIENRFVSSEGSAFGVYFQIDICAQSNIQHVGLEDFVLPLEMGKTFFPDKKAI